MESDTSENNLILVTNKVRFKRFCKIYKKSILVMFVVLILMPIAFVGENNAYLSFYIFLVTGSILLGDLLHPGVISFIPLALFTVMGVFNRKLINTITICNSVLDCLGVMLFILAVEQSQINKRIALKVLLIFGCSHFRLCFLLFLSTMMLSMWFSNCMACGLMMPLVKAILKELEKLGILETYEVMSKDTADSIPNGKHAPRPSDFTIFYFVGIAYSSTIGGMASFIGSETNQLFVNYCNTIFRSEVKLEFPQYLLLTLPGVIVMEIFLYLWLNFYFLGMLRVQNYTALQATLTSEEEQFISVLLTNQYQQMGKIKFQEMIVGITVLLAAILQAFTKIPASRRASGIFNVESYEKASYVPCMICIVILFLAPINLDCLKFFRRQNDVSDPLPNSPTRGCLTWPLVRNNINWSVLFITASANITFDSLDDSKMTDEFAKFLSLFATHTPAAQACIVIIFCKILTEFASSTTVARSLLLHIAHVGVKAKLNPLYLMLGANLSISLPFHLITGTPANAMVSGYVNIPPRKMIIAGVGPSLIAIVTNLFTLCVWSRVIWPDIESDHD